MDWYFPVLDRYLEYGYSDDGLVSVFRNIPVEMASVIKQSLHALQIIRASALSKAHVERDLCPVSESSAELQSVENMLDTGHEGCGRLRVCWDPATQVAVPATPRRSFPASLVLRAQPQ